MRGGERYYVEDRRQELIGGPGVYPFYLERGIYLVREGVGACRVSPELPDGGIPNDSLLVVRTDALEELKRRFSLKHQTEISDGKKENFALRKRIEAVLDYARNRAQRAQKRRWLSTSQSNTRMKGSRSARSGKSSVGVTSPCGGWASMA
jgi:hypothetical protein